jgi:hypothetical protein
LPISLFKYGCPFIQYPANLWPTWHTIKLWTLSKFIYAFRHFLHLHSWILISGTCVRLFISANDTYYCSLRGFHISFIPSRNYTHSHPRYSYCHLPLLQN